MTAETRFYAVRDPTTTAAFELTGETTPAERPPPTDIVDVTTEDGEWFPVKRALLRPCIKLTKAVMAGAGVHKEETPKCSGLSGACVRLRRIL